MTEQLTDAQLMEYAEKIVGEVVTTDSGDIDLTDAGRDFMATNTVSVEDQAKIANLIKDLINNAESTEEDAGEDISEEATTEA